MQTLYDFGIEVQKIREAINNITVKGADNASFVVYAVNKCNDIIKAINVVIEQQEQKPPESQNGENVPNDQIEADGTPTMTAEEGEVEDVEQDRGATSYDRSSGIR